MWLPNVAPRDGKPRYVSFEPQILDPAVEILFAVSHLTPSKPGTGITLHGEERLLSEKIANCLHYEQPNHQTAC